MGSAHSTADAFPRSDRVAHTPHTMRPAKYRMTAPYAASKTAIIANDNRKLPPATAVLAIIVTCTCPPPTAAARPQGKLGHTSTRSAGNTVASTSALTHVQCTAAAEYSRATSRAATIATSNTNGTCHAEFIR